LVAPKPFPLLNREISRLDYNSRVLARAEDPNVPLLERLRFLTYCSRNLDEFFMIRVGSTRDLIDARITERTADGLTPGEQLDAIRDRARQLLDKMYRCLVDDLLPALRQHGITVESFADLSADEKTTLRAWFQREVHPVLTPLAIDPSHPFPFVANQSLTLIAVVESARGAETVMLLKIPPTLPRFVPALPKTSRFVALGSIISANLDFFFPGFTVKQTFLFRVIRNSELAIEDDEVRDLRDSVEAELRRRDRKQVVCLEVEQNANDDLVQLLVEGTRTSADDVYRVRGLLKMRDLEEICGRVKRADLSYTEFNPRLPKRLASSEDIFSIIAKGDVLLHRPYESFTAVVELLHAAATDANVVAIKQALYQTDAHSPVLEKLALAAANGKQVTVIIELQARFEERKNIAWAQRLQDVGVQVVYGLVGLQTHAKMTVIVRAEGETLRHYVHASTGNYNAEIACSYTDLDLLTADETFGREASQLFNVVTGYSVRTLMEVFENPGDRPRWQNFVVAPFDYHRWLLEKIRAEADNARAGKAAGITAKLNSLVDPQVIQALYEASTAGVKIDLIVRSMCCLVPGVAGVSENIRVTSIVDRFLEHSRIIRFENAGNPQLFLSSGDWMPRNFQRRVEATFPLLDATTKETATQILQITLGDTASSWELGAGGSWTRRGGPEGIASQKAFIDIARAESLGVGSYEETLLQAAKFRRRAKKKRR
jgi:polyphosphate kinase